MPIRFSGLELLTTEQQELFKAYAFWDNVLVVSPEDVDYCSALNTVEEQLLLMGISPYYDSEYECYAWKPV